MGEESLTVSVTDSCQENESAVCQPTICAHTHKEETDAHTEWKTLGETINPVFG